MSSSYTNRKALKLATALYMVTDIMSEKEPLKWSLRDSAVGLLKDDNFSITRAIERVLDVLTIARIARAVSPMNADVLESELRGLAVQLVEEGDSVPTPAPLFDAKFFAVDAALPAPKAPIVPTEKKDTLPKAALKVTEPVATSDALEAKLTPIEEEVQRPVPPVAPVAPVVTPTPTQTPKPTAPVVPTFTPKIVPTVAAVTPQFEGIRSVYAPRVRLVDADVADRSARTEETRNERRDVILRTIKEKENCSIKDIAVKLPMVSDKTIQRELASMVEEGILAKEGDRRWSTYRLVGHRA